MFQGESELLDSMSPKINKFLAVHKRIHTATINRPSVSAIVEVLEDPLVENVYSEYLTRHHIAIQSRNTAWSGCAKTLKQLVTAQGSELMVLGSIHGILLIFQVILYSSCEENTGIHKIPMGLYFITSFLKVY